MLSRLIAFALTQRLLMALLTLLLIGGGWVAFQQLPIDAYPDVSSTQVKIIMKAPGMTPEEVEARIVTPIELEMLGIPAKRMLRSVSKYAIADITLDFEDGTDLYWARQQVNERLAGVLKDLPGGVSGGLAPITTPLGETLMFTIEGDLSAEEKRSLLDWVIRPQLRTLPGVADVNSLGGLVRSYEVVPDPAALRARGLGVDDLRQALEANNRNEGAGRLTEGEESSLVRIEGSLKSLDDLRALVVAHQGSGGPGGSGIGGSGGGNVSRVGDLAQVRIGSLTRYGYVTQGGQGEAVEGLVLALRGANARQLVKAVSGRLDEIGKTLPEGVSLHIFYNRGALVERAVGTVTKALGEAIVLVLILLLAFLGNLRAALVVACILPLAALGTFILMRLFGLSANLMSLGGLAIAIGMLVDAAVVVVENIETELARGSEGGGQRLPLLHRLYRAVREVAVPVVSGMGIIVIVFLPLLTLQGLEGKMFAPVALTIVFALSVSLLLSLTVIPVLASGLLKPGEAHEPRLMRWLGERYERGLRWALGQPRRVLAGAVGALLLAGLAFPFIGKAFIPTLDEGDITLQLAKLPSISLESSRALDLAVQKALLEKVPEIQNIIARTGSDELGLDPMGLNETDSFIVLKPREAWRQADKEWLQEQIREVMAEFPGVDISFTQPIEMRVAEMLTGTRGDVAVKIYGPDLETLNQLALKTESLLRTLPGAQDVLTVKNEGVQFYTVRIDRLAAGRFGLSVEAVASTLRTLLEGQSAGLVLEGNRRTPLMIRGDEGLRMSPGRFASTLLPLPDGGSVALSALARLEHVAGPVKIDHENAARYVVIQANVSGRDLVGFVTEAQTRMNDQIPLPEGYRVAFGGQFENQQRAAARLGLVVPVALLLIFFILFATFRRLRQAALVFANIPFAMIGGVMALLISGEYLSVPASVGFIALLGIAVLNGLVMIDYFNQLLAEGMGLEQVVVEGARRRLRPVLMTATIAAFGLVPLLFAHGPGAEIQRPLAIVVIGGLLSSTLLTLFVLPILFRRFGVESGPQELSHENL